VDAVDLASARFAALVAPAIDRLYRGAMITVRDKGGRDLVTRVGRPALAPLIVLRMRLEWPDGVVGAAGLEAVHRYHDPQEWRANLETSAGHGAAEFTPDGGLRATERGRELLGELTEHQATVTAELWSGEDQRVRRLLDALAILLEAGAPTGGNSFAALTPPYEPPSAPASLRLLTRLGALRYHRADAHAAAWSKAGLTADGIAEMPPGPERDAIEAETNLGAAPPFGALDAQHRLEFLADLAALS
jgi:hypothetical protein